MNALAVSVAGDEAMVLAVVAFHGFRLKSLSAAGFEPAREFATSHLTLFDVRQGLAERLPRVYFNL